MNNDTEELELGEEVTYKEFYVGVQYYEGRTPFASLYDNLNYIPNEVTKIYKIKIPLKI